MLQNGILEAPKTRYSAQSEKLVARNENELFWQWFWARIQKCFKTVFWRVQNPDIRFGPKKGSRAMKLSSSGNGFWPGARNAWKRSSEGSKTCHFIRNLWNLAGGPSQNALIFIKKLWNLAGGPSQNALIFIRNWWNLAGGQSQDDWFSAEIMKFCGRTKPKWMDFH